MTWHRINRHILFWATWLIYLSATKWYEQNPDFTTQYVPWIGSNILVKTFILLLIQAIATYLFIYVMMPRFLIPAKWLKLIFCLVILGTGIVAADYLLFLQVFPAIDRLLDPAIKQYDQNDLWDSIGNGLLNTPRIFAAAGAIKLMQYWQQKQQEKEILESEKISTELELLKAQVRPVFLLSTLHKIYTYALARSTLAADMLLKLSDLLSYMLYECNRPLVAIEKDLDMMSSYISLEKTRQDGNIETEFNVNGHFHGKNIAPFIIFPFIENAFRHCALMTEQAWINLTISTDSNSLVMKLVNGISPTCTEQDKMDTTALANAQKRLTLLYPEAHELIVNIEQEMLVVLLRIEINESNIRKPSTI